MAVTVVPPGRLTATGVLLSVVVPLPSWPLPLSPQASTWPVEVSARLWRLPPAMAVTAVPEGRLTATGVLLLVVLPLPSSPYALSPQASTWPVEVSARLWLVPPAIAVTVVPEGRLTATGMLLMVVVPLPSWPWRVRPQASTWPVEVSARLWSPPAMAVTVVPEGRLTATGVLLLVVLPLPSWPLLLLPQASTWPVEVSARLWRLPPAMAVVPEGRLTATGVLLSVVVPLPSWPKPFKPQAQAEPGDPVYPAAWLSIGDFETIVTDSARIAAATSSTRARDVLRSGANNTRHRTWPIARRSS